MVGMWLPPDILDRTAKTPGHYRIRNRMSSQIDTVVLHQTSFSRGSVPDNYLSVHAHFVVLPNGGIVQLHPIDAYLVASSAFNDDAISVEVVGNFPDERGQYWKPDANGRSSDRQHRYALLEIFYAYAIGNFLSLSVAILLYEAVHLWLIRVFPALPLSFLHS